MSSYEEEVLELRKEINRLNAVIVNNLSQRVNLAIRISEVKRKHGLPIVDKKREAKVYMQVQELASEYQLDSIGVKRIFREIIRLCTEAEKRN
jgi:chorismate mutase